MIIKEYVQAKKQEMRDEVASFKRAPSLVIIQVNEDAGSNAYVKGKLKDAAEIGLDAKLIKLPIDIKEEQLLQEIEKVNNDDSVDGLIVQMPLPKGINEEKVKLAVNPSKDVDGFHPLSIYDPCTPKGIINYLRDEGFNFVGKNAVVIGRSNIVGKPMAKLLTKEHMNVIVLHSRTTKEDMDFYLGHADLVVVAVGKKHFLKDQPLKEDAYVVDVGINRDEDGLHGDAAPNLKVKLQTPVPGGVGLLTRLTLMVNLIEAYKHHIK